MTTTIRETNALSVSDTLQAMEIALVVVHHPNAHFLGLRRVVLAKGAVDLGRETGAFGEDSLDHPLISRLHARVAVDYRGQCTINDLGSANGTWVDGIRVVSSPVQTGSIIRIGPVLLSVQHAPGSYATRRSERAPIIAYNTALSVERLRLQLTNGGIWRIDPQSLHESLPYLEWLAEELSIQYLGLCPWSSAERALTESASPCVVIVDPATTSQLQLQLAANRQDGLNAVLARARSSCIVVQSTRENDPVSGESSERSAVFSFAPLTSRIEDIPWLVRGALQKHFSAPVSIDHTLAFRLVRASWPEDIQGLHQWASMAIRRWPTGQLTVCDEDLKYTGEPQRLVQTSEQSSQGMSSTTPLGTATHLVIAHNGGWFAIGNEPLVDIRTRFALTRILRALVQQRAKDHEETVSIDTLVEAGWPGEKLLNDSGTNRLYVAVATLRKLGLRDGVERREGGYRLAPHWSVAVSESETPVTDVGEQDPSHSQAKG